MIKRHLILKCKKQKKEKMEEKELTVYEARKKALEDARNIEYVADAEGKDLVYNKARVLMLLDEAVLKIYCEEARFWSRLNFNFCPVLPDEIKLQGASKQKYLLYLIDQTKLWIAEYFGTMGYPRGAWSIMSIFAIHESLDISFHVRYI